MTVDALADQIETSASHFRFVRATIQLDQTRFSVKYRLEITSDLWVQVYWNVQNDTVGLVLIYQGRRLYGRDCEAGRWHRHPADDPERPTSLQKAPSRPPSRISCWRSARSC